MSQQPALGGATFKSQGPSPSTIPSKSPHQLQGLLPNEYLEVLT